MPFPFIPVVITIAGLLGLGSIVVVSLASWKKKKIAVLGARSTGKTTLIRFLTTGEIPEKYKQTVRPEKATGRKFKLQELELNIAELIDLPGSEDYKRDWGRAIEKSDVIFYLFRMDKIYRSVRHERMRINRDIDFLLKFKKTICLVGTHVDKIGSDFSASDEQRNAFIEKLKKHQCVREILVRAGGSDKVNLILGSMVSKGETEVLVFNLFKECEKN